MTILDLVYEWGLAQGFYRVKLGSWRKSESGWEEHTFEVIPEGKKLSYFGPFVKFEFAATGPYVKCYYADDIRALSLKCTDDIHVYSRISVDDPNFLGKLGEALRRNKEFKYGF